MIHATVSRIALTVRTNKTVRLSFRLCATCTNFGAVTELVSGMSMCVMVPLIAWMGQMRIIAQYPVLKIIQLVIQVHSFKRGAGGGG